MSIRGAANAIYSGATNAGAVAQSFVVKIMVLGINAATSVIVARALSPTGRGEMSAIILWPGFFASLLTLGLPSALIIELRKKPERARQIVYAALSIAGAVGCISGVVGYALVPHWLNHYSQHDVGLARWILLASPLPILLLIGRASLEAAGDFWASNLSLWSAPVLTLLSLVVLSTIGHLNSLTSGLSYTLAVVPAAAFLMNRMVRRYRPTRIGSLAQIKGLLRYGLRAWGTDLLNALALSEHVLVVYFLTPAEMGTYVVAASLARMLSVFPTSIVTVLLPRVAMQAPDEVVSLTGLTFRLTTACSLLCACFAGACGPSILQSVYGSRYAEGGSLAFRILLIEVVFSGATQVLAQAYLALDRPGTITIIQAAGVALGLASMPHLIKQFGAAGAPCALLLSSILRLLTTLYGIKAWLHLPIPNITLSRRDFAFVKARLPGRRSASALV